MFNEVYSIIMFCKSLEPGAVESYRSRRAKHAPYKEESKTVDNSCYKCFITEDHRGYLYR